MKLYSGHQVFLTGLLCAAAGAALAYYSVKISAADKEKPSVQAKAEDYLTENESFPMTNAVSQIPVSDTTGYTKDELQNILVYEKCNEAVVNITTQTMGYNWFYEPVITSSGSGSGSIIDVRGYVVTNYHVIKNASTITISLADGTSYDGRIIGQDKESDIAVLKFDPDDSVELKTIAFGENSGLKVGQKVIAIGNPLGELGGTVTYGYVSALERELSVDGSTKNLMQVDAAVNPGNSGGGLFNINGELIGVVNAKSTGYDVEGLGFAIPVNDVSQVISDILTHGYATGRAFLGVSLSNGSTTYSNPYGGIFGYLYGGYSLQYGATVEDVLENSQIGRASCRERV